MAYTGRFFASKANKFERGQSDDFRREELIRVIEWSWGQAPGLWKSWGQVLK